MSTLTLKIAKPVNSNKVDNTWLDKSLSDVPLSQEIVLADLKLGFIDGQYRLLQDIGAKTIKKESFLIGEYQLYLTVDDEVSLDTKEKEEPYFGSDLKNFTITDFDLNPLNDLIRTRPIIADSSAVNLADSSEFLSDPLAFLENGLPVTENLQPNLVLTTKHEKDILKIS